MKCKKVHRPDWSIFSMDKIAATKKELRLKRGQRCMQNIKTAEKQYQCGVKSVDCQ